ncbi:uncharacterized protein LOC115886316 [Sitophilus oryzae]|uniref:Uncharacterized protein LOC115886316 n=1 Tax=Sitophilus oryzae TaxID=7048 RepID=A0A6J2YD43_SITOR|nr:uncharacterized protein LOC115886316 [Sitophilus oryzae]
MHDINILTDIIIFLNNLAGFGVYEIWDSKTFNFSTMENNNLNGILTITNPKLFATVSNYQMHLTPSVIQTDEGNFKACVNDLGLSSWNFTMDYYADIGINNKTPIYGAGTYWGQLSNITLTMCWLMPPDVDEIIDFDIDIQFRHGPGFFGGVYHNEDLNPIFSEILSRARYVLAMWNTYEPTCLKQCIFNPVIYFMTNYLIYNIDKYDELNWSGCDCIEEIKNDLTSQLEISENNFGFFGKLLITGVKNWMVNLLMSLKT